LRPLSCRGGWGRGVRGLSLPAYEVSISELRKEEKRTKGGGDYRTQEGKCVALKASIPTSLGKKKGKTFPGGMVKGNGEGHLLRLNTI